MGQREALTEEYRKSGCGEVCREFTREEDFVIMRDGVGLHTFIFLQDEVSCVSVADLYDFSLLPQRFDIFF